MDSATTHRRSRYRGICWDRKHNSWRVTIFYAGKQRHVGRYADDVAAAKAYDKAAVYLYGSQAITNFGLQACLEDPTPVKNCVVMAKMMADSAAPYAMQRRDVEALQQGRNIHQQSISSFGTHASTAPTESVYTQQPHAHSLVTVQQQDTDGLSDQQLVDYQLHVTADLAQSNAASSTPMQSLLCGSSSSSSSYVVVGHPQLTPHLAVQADRAGTGIPGLSRSWPQQQQQPQAFTDLSSGLYNQQANQPQHWPEIAQRGSSLFQHTQAQPAMIIPPASSHWTASATSDLRLLQQPLSHANLQIISVHDHQWLPRNMPPLQQQQLVHPPGLQQQDCQVFLLQQGLQQQLEQRSGLNQPCVPDQRQSNLVTLYGSSASQQQLGQHNAAGTAVAQGIAVHGGPVELQQPLQPAEVGQSTECFVDSFLGFGSTPLNALALQPLIEERIGGQNDQVSQLGHLLSPGVSGLEGGHVGLHDAADNVNWVAVSTVNAPYIGTSS